MFLDCNLFFVFVYLLETSGAERNRRAYKIVEELPQSSEQDDAASSSEEEWLPGQERKANASSSDSGAEDAESGKDAEGDEDANDGEVVEAEDLSPNRAQGKRTETKLSGN